jgi:multidrug resistance protein, MATE family
MPGSAAHRFLDFGAKSQEGEAGEQLSIGLSAAGSGILEAGSFNVLVIISGVAGIVQVGAFNIAMNMMSIGFMPAMGLASATVDRGTVHPRVHPTARSALLNCQRCLQIVTSRT